MQAGEFAQTQTARPRAPVAGWDGIERRNGLDRRSGKDRRSTMKSTLHGIFNWVIGKSSRRSGEDRRITVKDRRSRVRAYF